MFKSIEYKLYFYMVLLIAAIVISTVFAIERKYLYLALSLFIVIILLDKLRRSYNQFNKNIVFLLNALDSGDYSCNFTETKLSRRERELNRVMNRIKEILSKARKEVIENEKFLSVILESVPNGVIIMNEVGQIIQINRSVKRLLGLPVFTHLNQLSKIDKSFPSLFRNIEVSDSNTIKISNEREEAQLSLKASQIKIHGETLKVITLSNIGNELDSKELDSWIRLIRVMTHEIMNSIAPVTSLTEMMLTTFREEGYEEDPQKRYIVESLQTIHTTAKGLSGFVNSYRRLTGIPKPVTNPVSMQSLIRHALLLEAASLDEKRVLLILELPAEPIIKEVDEPQMTQVLLNLLKNAAEAISDKNGEIKISLSEENEKIHLDISNNGDPIPDEVLPNIFVPFFTTKQSGTGIGLSLSRYIIRLHNGTLTHFTKGDRTVFRITL